MEPQLMDMLGVLGRLVEGEKTLITGGVDQSTSYSLEFVANNYFRSKEAVQTLKAIVNDGLSHENVDMPGLLNLLNVDSSKWHMGPPEREQLATLKAFVQEYGPELVAEVGRKAARYTHSAADRQRAEAAAFAKIENFSERFGANRPRT
ncbi:MAG: hypothetical protein EBV03_04795 [Proteobacteria bacterium]|nr:hypothetical protein [Pseudomonadota bacterium]